MLMIYVILSTMVIQIWKEPWKSTRISALLWDFTGKFNQEPHYFKYFEFCRQKMSAFFPHLNRKGATKGLAF